MSAVEQQWFGLSVSHVPESNIQLTWVFDGHMQFVAALQIAIATGVHLIEAHVYLQRPRTSISTSSDFFNWVMSQPPVADE